MSFYTQSSVGPGAPVEINRLPYIFECGVSLTVGFASGGGVGTAKVEVSDDPLSINPLTALQAAWQPHDVLVNLTADTVSNLAYPVLAVRLNVTSYTSGSISFGVGQAHH